APQAPGREQLRADLVVLFPAARRLGGACPRDHQQRLQRRHRRPAEAAGQGLTRAATEYAGSVMPAPTAAATGHVDDFALRRLPPRELWPAMIWPTVLADERAPLNCAAELLDGAVKRGWGGRAAVHYGPVTW